MDTQTLSLLFDLVLELLALLFPALALYASLIKKTKSELLTILDQSPVNNRALEQMAENLSLKKAVKELKSLAS
ncbi:MAG: hypothetical protein QNL04_00770 [SAR324 cluster bacterium]|nr:hypothetical protein [SAR324 cluster bacterium]